MEGSYGPLAKVLHHLALGTNVVPEMCFDLEQTIYGNSSKSVGTGNHVFVAGLARAGTTVLMRELFRTQAFRSLTYRDMPFVLATNLWAKMTRRSRKELELQHRAHSDGILVNFDSPEALEEVFWRVFAGKRYIGNHGLSPMVATDGEIQLFRDYIATLLRSSDTTRYLSKNNNNILRLSSIAQAFPESTILVPFRDPVQQANSLLRQHRRFLEIHGQDRFSLQYMNWLVHHEFGANHVRFLVNSILEDRFSALDINYWISIWIDVYRYLIGNLPSNALMICYETLCNGSGNLWPRILSRLQLDSAYEAPDFRLATHSVTDKLDPELSETASTLFQELKLAGDKE